MFSGHDEADAIAREKAKEKRMDERLRKKFPGRKCPVKNCGGYLEVRGDKAVCFGPWKAVNHPAPFDL